MHASVANMRVALCMFVALVAGVACSSQPKVDVSATCYVDTDKSMDITRPTIFAKVHVSTDAEDIIPFVRVEMFDEQGTKIGDAQFSAGLVTQGEPKDVIYPVGIPVGGVDNFSTCTASDVGTDGRTG